MNGQGSSPINADVVIMINQRIDKLEVNIVQMQKQIQDLQNSKPTM